MAFRATKKKDTVQILFDVKNIYFYASTCVIDYNKAEDRKK